MNILDWLIRTKQEGEGRWVTLSNGAHILIKDPTEQDIHEAGIVVQKWQSSESGYNLSRQEMQTLSKFNLTGKTTLYKGGKIHWGEEDLPETGSQREVQFDRPGSWSTDRGVAESFMVSNGNLGKLNDAQLQNYGSRGFPGVVVSRTFTPKETLFSFDRFRQVSREHGIEFPGFQEGEVIVKPGRYSGTVVTTVGQGQLRRH